MKNVCKLNIVVIGVITLLFIGSLISALAQTNIQKVDTVDFSITFSTPIVKENNNFCEIIVSEANSVTTKEGYPMMPVYSKTFEFPLGVHIISVDISPSMIQTMNVDKQVKPVPTKQNIDNQIMLIEGRINEKIYKSNEPSPSSWYTISTGAGLNKNNERVLFVSCHITPVRYLAASHLLMYISHVNIQITFDPVMPASASSDGYSFVVISPSEFSEALQPLVEHKNAHDVPTKLVTLDDIYSSFTGRDNPEKIKFFIKYAVEDWHTQYILLVGDIKKLPIRSTQASWWEKNLLTDLYYADIYNANKDFCSWDKNNNNRFSEIDRDGNDLDGVDLYADVHLGRVPCSNTTEVKTIVNKIITYEDDTYNQIWFKRIVLAGGDTFPPFMGSAQSVFEGEITNTKVAQNLPEFDTTFLWTSNNALNPLSFNREINKGTGFVSYSGHGFEHGWGTYKPNALSDQGMIWYFTPYLVGLKNENELPIIFFDACLTAKLDFNFTDLQHYYPNAVHFLTRIFKLSEDPSMFYQCFAKSFIIKENGGAIATIGATRSAYTHVDADGVYGGAGYLNVHFFDSYNEGVTVGEMLTQAQNAYINNVFPDYFTIEEFILLGDPSLMVGGYS